MNGYQGHILAADLSKDEIHSIPIDENIAKAFVGGSGYASYLLNYLLNPKSDPLGPENMLLFMTGPLTGTLAPCTGRHVVCGKSPITGLWGESHAGGHFGAQMKAAGVDGILITGTSKKPVILQIYNRDAEILDATDLWGMDTEETQKHLKKENKRSQVSCIGQAGENLVKYASIVNDERVAARCGLGAVMGSKKLKAIIVQGDLSTPLGTLDEFNALALSSSKILGEAMSMLRDQGTAMYVDIGMMFNDIPIRYFQDVEFDDIDLINAGAIGDILTGRIACHSCPIGCGRKVSIPDSPLENIAGPEYQTIAAFGTNLLISDLKKIVLMNRLCNQYGMDTISCGSTIALATQLSKIGKANYDLQWDDADRVIELIHHIAQRKGIGDILAEGSLALGKKHDAENMVLHVNGLEIPNHDPRAFSGMATVYVMASRGATHLEGDMYSVDMGADVRELGITSGDRLENHGKGSIAARAQDFRAFFDSVIMCHFAIVPPQKIIDLLNLAIGQSYTLEDLLKIGARSVTMKRIFNLRAGLTPQNEKLPQALLTPQADSVTDDFIPDLDLQLEDYYKYRKWDQLTGRPTKEALHELGLDIN
ncbi:MAG: aldehyde ferredoxin oxidoreductase family protein [Candidatus Thorarchaeota archaeon]|nr:aldehyde ferredoxin oxidoreductase family protein [Candidatus Thorarchaeota archaeon]